MTREEYALKWKGGHARKGNSVTVPADVERVQWHEPCGFCGTARGCKHRLAA